MSPITPVERSELREFEPLFKAVESAMGFVPNSFLTMARWHEMLNAFSGYASTVMGPGEVAVELKQLMAFVVSQAAGCRYCQAHTAHGALHKGVPKPKIQAIFEFETSALFDAAERAALRVALHAGMVPNATEPEHFSALKVYFTDRQIVELVAVLALFGSLNRWNDTMATMLEPEPADFAKSTLDHLGWQLGKHA